MTATATSAIPLDDRDELAPPLDQLRSSGVSDISVGMESGCKEAGACKCSCKPCDPRYENHCGNHGSGCHVSCCE